MKIPRLFYSSASTVCQGLWQPNCNNYVSLLLTHFAEIETTSCSRESFLGCCGSAERANSREAGITDAGYNIMRQIL
jgi:hypothetical protein